MVLLNQWDIQARRTILNGAHEFVRGRFGAKLGIARGGPQVPVLGSLRVRGAHRAGTAYPRVSIFLPVRQPLAYANARAAMPC